MFITVLKTLQNYLTKIHNFICISYMTGYIATCNHPQNKLAIFYKRVANLFFRGLLNCNAN